MTKKKTKKKSKSNSSIMSLFFYFIFPTIAIVFLFLILQTEIKFLYKEIDSKEKNLEVLQNIVEGKLVEVQKLSTEDRIVKIAKTRLGMVRIKNSVENIFVSNLKIKQIQRIVDSKYE
jgi:cell division protein FtsL